VEELTHMMLEDLALPWLEDKEAQQITTHTYNFDDVRRKARWPIWIKSARCWKT